MFFPFVVVILSTALFESGRVSVAAGDAVCRDGGHVHGDVKSSALLQQFVWRSRPDVPLGNYTEDSYIPLVSKGLSDHFSLQKFLLVSDRNGTGTLAGFNPSVVLLPPEVAFELVPGTRYAAAVRHYKDQCSRFGFLRDRVHTNGSMLVLLDEDLNPVGAAHIEATNRSNCQDVRLFVLGKQLLASCVVYEELFQWHFHWTLQQLHLNMSSGLSFAAHFGEVLASYEDQKNLGLMQQDDKLQVLWFMNAESAVVYTQPLTLVSEDLHQLHNNVNPLYLPEEGAYLCVIHTYEQGSTEDESTFWRHHYYHRFVLINDDLHHDVLRTSPLMCFPSAVKESSCETVQFVMSIVRDGGDLLISYGINDCEAAIVRVPLSAVLAFLRREGDFAGESEVTGLQSQWLELDPLHLKQNTLELLVK